MEPSINAFCSQRTAQFSRDYVLSGRNQRTLSYCQRSNENNSFVPVRIASITVAFTVQRCATAPRRSLQFGIQFYSIETVRALSMVTKYKYDAIFMSFI